mgnify:CR=1 FL=1
MNNIKDTCSLTFRHFEKSVADFKIRLRYDNLTQTQFFRSIVDMYLSNDPKILSVIEKVKEKEKSMGKAKRKKAKAEAESSICFSNREKQDLFDLIEGQIDWGPYYEK